MSDEIDWHEEALGFDSNAALGETRIMWLKLGRQFSQIVDGFTDFLAEPKNGDEAIQWAARAEACFWRATGDSSVFEVGSFIRTSEERGGQADV